MLKNQIDSFFIGDNMKAVGIICEYNPFHNGHLYHLNQVKKMFPNHTIILVVSGPFTQRADASILTKWEKTEIALFYGVDLVIELPFIFATGSADLFAYGAIQILNQLQVEYLVFGSEENNIEKLSLLAQAQTDESVQKNIKQLLKQGCNYPTALSRSLEQKTHLKVTSPNDLLGISYIKEIQKSGSITPITIQRTNQYHEQNLDPHITSATSIRIAIKENKDIKNVIPEKTNEKIHKDIHIESFYPFLKYKIITSNNLNQYHEVTKNIIPRIQKNINTSYSLEELIQKIKTKNETYSKLKRIFLYILCGLTKEEASFYKKNPYIRILGFNNIGRSYLNTIKKEITIPVFTNYSNDTNHLLALDYKVHQVYTMIFQEPFKSQLLQEETKRPPIHK